MYVFNIKLQFLTVLSRIVFVKKKNNHSIMKKVRSMFSDSFLCRAYWQDAAKTAVFSEKQVS